jgi:PAS domain S-box-containing protein
VRQFVGSGLNIIQMIRNKNSGKKIHKGFAESINRFTLSFKGDLEREFKEQSIDGLLPQLRLAIISAIILFGAFGFLDHEVVPGGDVAPIWFVRYKIYIPVMLAALLFTFTSAFRKIAQPFVCFLVFFTGGCIIFMFYLVPPEAKAINYFGLIILVVFSYSFVRLRFIWAIVAGWGIHLVYIAVEMFLLDSGVALLLSNNFYLLTANLLGMIAGYYLEYYNRRDFYTARLLEKEKENTARLNIELEEKIVDRTAELRRINQNLKKEMQERSQTEEALRNSEMLYRLVVENSYEAVFIIDDNYSFIFHNERLAEMLGHAGEDLTGKDFRHFLDPDSYQQVVERYKRRQRGEDVPAQYEMKIKMKSGEIRDANLSSVSFESPDNKTWTMGQLLDITDRKKAEKALLESEKKYRNLVEHSNEIIIVAQDNKLKFVNKKALEVTGYTYEEAYSMPFLEFVYPDDRAEIFRRYQNRLSGVPTESLHKFRIMKKDGSTRWAQISSVLIDWNGRPANLNFLSDIDEMVRAEKELKVSENKYRALVDNVHDSVFLLKDLRFHTINRKTIDMFGYSEKEMQGSMPSEFSPARQPDGRNSMEKAQEKILNALHGNPQHFEWKHKRSDGKVFDAEVSLIRLEVSGEIMVQAVVRDVTARKNAERQLKEHEQFLRSIIDINPSLIFVKDKDGRFVMVNQAVADIYASTVDNIIGKTDNDFNPDPREVEFFRKKDSEVLDLGRELFIAEETVSSPNGATRYYQTFKKPIEYINGKKCLLGVSTDITDRKKIEQQLKQLNEELELRVEERTSMMEDAMQELRREVSDRKRAEKELREARDNLSQTLEIEKELNELKTRFISMISHEYRTPLTGILTATYIIEQMYEGDNIRKSINSMTKLLDEVLTIGRSEAGKLKPKYEDKNINELLEDIIHDQKIIDDYKHRFIFEERADEELFSTDEELFRQIINNLLSNAAKYSPEGADIIIKTEQTPGTLIISVEDSGRGIEMADLPHIYEPFHRGKNIGMKSGTGLGLAIVKRCVDALKGTVSASSEQDNGSTFTVRLPKNPEDI